MLERGEKIEVLVDKTEDLQNQAQRFQVQGRNLRNKMWWQNMKVKVRIAPHPPTNLHSRPTGEIQTNCINFSVLKI